MLCNERIKFSVALHIGTRLNFMFHERRKRFLRKHFTCEANTGAEILPILRGAHIVKRNLRRVIWVIATQCDSPARRAAHGTHMSLETMTFRRCLSIIAHRNGKKVILDIRILDTCF